MQEELKILLSVLREVGQTIVVMRHETLSIELKANNDIVTAADIRANDLLRAALMGHFPSYGWLSEESVDDLSRLERARVWVVDPIDGTIEFARNIPEYAISVALVEHGDPLLAAIYNPATDELFHAIKDQGAWLNGGRIRCDHAVSQEHLTLLASRSEEYRGEWDHMKDQHTIKVVGSIAYKLGLVAAGKADATFSLRPKSEWDIAAGVLIVNESGGVAVDRLGRPFIFNQADVIVNGVIGSAGDAIETVLDMINVQ